VFLNREIERKAEKELDRRRIQESERRQAAILEKRFNFVPICEIKSRIVSINSRVLHGIMKEISPELDVSREAFNGENRETYWKSVFDFKRLKQSKKTVFMGMIETDGVTINGHSRRFKEADRPGQSSISLSAMHIKNRMRRVLRRRTTWVLARTPATRIS
jgi:hypothetical protein